MEEIKVEGHPDLIRDPLSGAIVNKNQAEYKNYIEIKRKRESEKNRINNIETDLSSLKFELNEIKHLLQQLVSK